jgi:hypothetical protein
VPKPMEGTAVRESVFCSAGDRAGIAGWYVTRPVLAGFGTGCPNPVSVLFGRS